MSEDETSLSVPEAGGEVAIPQSDEELLDELRRRGIAGPGGRRIRIESDAFLFGDNPEPQEKFQCIILGYHEQNWYWDETLNDGRGGICRSLFDNPNEGGRVSNIGRECAPCPFRASGDCKWRMELDLLLPDSEDGEPWLLNLPTTGVIEFRGTTRRPLQGIVSDYHYIARLIRKGWIDAFEKKRVVTEISTKRTTSQGGEYKYNCITFEPVSLLDASPELPSAPPTTPKSVKIADEISSQEPEEAQVAKEPDEVEPPPPKSKEASSTKKAISEDLPL